MTPRVASHERHAQRLLVHEALIEIAVIAQKEALVGGIDHDRILAQSFRVQVIQHAADVVVD